MPIYEFECRDCGKISEVICNAGEDGSKITCANCGSNNVEKIFSVPARVDIANKESTHSNISGCCGSTNPCENPKRCCEK